MWGLVLDESGEPAPNIKVTAYLANSNPLIGNAGAGLAGNSGSGYRIASSRGVSAGTEGKTDALGRFAVQVSVAGTYNLEAFESDASKAWQAKVVFAGGSTRVDAGSMRLAPTGSISGRVRSAASTVKDFSNTWVFIPGAGYTSVTKADGSYTIPHVPAGFFELGAYNVDLGDGLLPDADNPGPVRVVSGDDTVAGTIVLKLTPPELERVTFAGATESIDNAPAGMAVDLHGAHFGQDRGTRFQVQFSGGVLQAPDRQSEKRIRVEVPNGAINGQVVVAVGGLLTRALDFRIMKSFALLTAELDLAVGQSYDLGQVVSAHDSDGIAIVETPSGAIPAHSRPSIAWSLDNARAALTPRGMLTALSVGTASVTASAGKLGAKALTLTILPAGTSTTLKIFGVAIAGGDVVLNALPATGSPDPSFLTAVTVKATVSSSDGKAHAVTWAVSGGSNLVSLVSPVNGDPNQAIVSTRPGAPEGKAEIEATSLDDPAFSATASIAVTIKGTANVELR